MGEQRVIYICSHDEDLQLKQEIQLKLEQRNIKILDIEFGEWDADISDQVGQHEFLWLITSKSIEENLCSLELLTVVEDGYRKDKIRAVLLRHEVSNKKLIRVAHIDLMETIDMKISADGTWVNEQVDEVLQKLTEITVPSNKLPAGNLSHGFAYSHFFGFHNVVLKHLEARIMDSSWFKENPGRMSLKIYELLPRSCKFPGLITMEDERVQHVGYLEKIEVTRAGNKGRPYELPVYKMEQEGKSYFCVAQFPNAIGAIPKMIENEMPTVGDVDISVQLTRFYYTLETILEHPVNKVCNDKVRFLLYNDVEKKPYDVLLKAVMNDLELQMEGPLDTMPDHLTMALPPYQRLLSQGLIESPVLQETATIPLHDVCIIQDEENTDDNQIALLLADSFSKNRIKVFNRRRGQPVLFSLEQAVLDSKWILVILSKKSLANRTWKEPWCLVSRSIEVKRLMMIALLVDISPEKVPNSLRWLTYVDYTSQHYFERLCGYIKGEKIAMELQTWLPAGNIGYGLAGGYLVNYLKIVLPEFVRHIPATFQEKKICDYICPDKLYIAVPDSCKAIGPLDQGRGDYVKHCFKLCTIDDHQAGTNIIKSLDVYRIKESPDSDKVYYFVGQFPAAVTCLYEMNETLIAGLKEDTMLKEKNRFCDTITRMLSPEVAARCQFVKFDDSRPEGLSEELIPRIKKDWENKSHEYADAVASR